MSYVIFFKYFSLLHLHQWGQMLPNHLLAHGHFSWLARLARRCHEQGEVDPSAGLAVTSSHCTSSFSDRQFAWPAWV